MKSFCVLNSAITPAAGESIGAAVASVLGGKLGVLYCGSQASFTAAINIAKGIKKQGGCAVLFSGAFEAQTAFACGHYALDGAFFIDGDEKCSISVCGCDARSLSAETEEEISQLASQQIGGHRGGFVTESDLNSAYYKHLLETCESLVDVSVNVKSPNLFVKTPLSRLLSALGGEQKGRITFFLSASGFCLSAVDEYGKIYTHNSLLAVCCALAIEKKQALEIPFSLPESIDIFAQKKGVGVKRSFEGGDDLWQKDAVFLAAMLMKYMSQKGCGLAALCEILPQTAMSRKSFSSALSIDEIADVIDCNQIVTDGNSVFARAEKGNILVTPCSKAGKYCLEVQAADSETAREMALNLTDICN